MQLVDYSMSAVAAIRVHVCIWFGGLVRRLVPEETIRIFVLIVVIVSGLELLRKGLF